MTLTLSTLSDIRRQELQTGDLLRLPPNFLQDLAECIPRVQKEAGPHPETWPEDCEPLAARALLEDIFRIRRGKLARAAEANPIGDPPMPSALLPFESNTWFALTADYRRLDAAVAEVCRTGKWSGVWK
jgi:DNA replication initiation complex subunit (GINS family)